MGYINESLRASRARLPQYNNLQINLNGEKWFTGDKQSICMIWNNLVGCNHDDRKSHVDYFSIWPDVTNEDIVTLVNDHKILMSVKIKELNLWDDV